MKTDKEIEWLKAMSRTNKGNPEKKQEPPIPHAEAKPVVKAKAGGFKEVAGFEDLKQKVEEEFIKVIRNPRKASFYGVRASNMLFYGPPGTGKTYFAEKMAEELGIEFMKITPDELGSIYIHGSQQKIRECFDKAIKKAPVLMVFDEIDALVPQREQSSGANQNGETNEFLVMLNSLVEKNVYVVGMTNNLGNIDKAVLRTGRFDQLVYFPMPDEKVRESLLKYYLCKKPVSDEIDYKKLAKMTAGYNCSDIEYMTIKASLVAFNESLDSENDEVIPISQELMEKVISGLRYSVTPEEVDWYEKMSCEYGFKQAESRAIRKVGFVI